MKVFSILSLFLVTASGIKLSGYGVNGDGRESDLNDNRELVFDYTDDHASCGSLQYYAEHKISDRLTQAANLFDMGSCEEHMSDPGADFGVKYKKGEGRKGNPIHFLHLPKTGGAFLCQCAKNHMENRDSEQTGNGACSALKEDDQFFLREDSYFQAKHNEHKGDCAALGEEYTKKKLTFEANANFLPGGKLCPQFNNVISLRNPINRIVAHLAEVEGSEKVRNLTLDRIKAKYPHLADNYYVRVLGGEKSFFKTSGMLTASHLRAAITALEGFDHVFIQGSGLAHQVKAAFNWDCDEISVRGKRSQSRGGTAELVSHFQTTWPAGDWAHFKNMHALDMVLFDVAKHLSLANIMISKKDLNHKKGRPIPENLDPSEQERAKMYDNIKKENEDHFKGDTMHFTNHKKWKEGQTHDESHHKPSSMLSKNAKALRKLM